ncbi:MAG: T9SS type A sorting domain-containing protein [Bacteroidota bacterium]
MVELEEPDEYFNMYSTKPSRDITGGFDVSCRNNDGIISVTTSNEPGRFVNEALTVWTRNNVPFTPNDNYRAENLSAGRYRVQMVDDHGCIAAITEDLSPHPGIIVNTLATPQPNGYATSCSTSSDGSGRVTNVHNARNGIYYLWEFNGNETETIDGLAAGTYKVTVTDGNGCVDDGFLTITSPPEIDPNLQVVSNYNGDQISCPEAADGIIEAFPLNGYGTYTYEWDHGVFTKAADNLARGTYRVTVRDALGCEATASLAINDPPVMQTEITTSDFNGAGVSCFGANDGEAVLSILEGVPQSFEWSNGATTQNVSGLSAGTYEVLITSINGCVVHNSVEISEPAAVTSMVSHAVDYSGFGVRCFGDENGAVVAAASGGVAPYTYSWSNGITDPLNENIGFGKYHVVVTDLNGCVKKDSIEVTAPPPLSLTGEQIEAVSCFGLKDGVFRLQGAGGAGDYRYSMNPATWQNSRYFDTLSVGTKRFFVMDQNGCEASTTGMVTQPDVLEVHFPPESIVKAACNDPVGSVLAVAAGGNEGYQFAWVNDMDQTPLGSEANLVGLIAGIYGVTVTDARGCQVTDRVAVSSIGGAEFEIENIRDVSCFGGNDGEASVRVISAEMPVSFLWSSNATHSTATTLTAGNYFLTVTDNLGCKTIQSFNIGSPEALRAGIVKTVPLCQGDCNGLLKSSPTGGTAPYQFSWRDFNVTQSELANVCAGDYQLTITDDQGCVLTENITLNEPDLLTVAAVATPPVCLGRCDGTLSATATGGTGSYLYTWDTGRSEAVINELCPGDYEVTVQDANGCLAEAQFTVPEGEILAIDLGEVETLCVGQKKELDPGSQWVTVHWVADNGFESKDRAVTIQQEGIYRIDAVNNIGCLGTGTFELRTSLDLLQAAFILQTEAVVGDTLVAIDISWPLPDSTQWVYPSVMSKLVETDDFLHFIPTEPGDYQVVMRSFLGDCRAFEEKQLLVRVRDAEEDPNGRLGFDGIVTDAVLSPNPSNGVFELELKTSRAVPVHVRVVEPLTGRIVADQQAMERQHFTFGFDLSHLTAGVYLVWMQAGDEKHLWRLVKY